MTRYSRHNFVRCLMAGASLSIMAASAASAQSIMPLDSLPGYAWSYVHGISGDGSILVGYAENPGQSAAYWEADGTAHEFGLASDIVTARDISRDGTVIVGGVYTNNPPDIADAWAYRIGDAGHTILPKTIFGGATIWAYAIGANADGSVIVGEQSDGFDTMAVMWSGVDWTTETNLGTLSGLPGEYSTARAVSDDGSIVVGMSTDMGTGYGFYWTAGTMHALGLAPGQSHSSAQDISGDGSTVVGNVTIGGNVYAYSWTGPNFSIATDLTLPGTALSQALGVNGDGSVIVGMAVDPIDGLHYAFRHANGVTEYLDTLLADAGIDMTGIRLEVATDVSTNGEYIAAMEIAPGLSYLVYLGAGGPGGLTTGAAQQASVDALGDSRQALAVQQDIYTGLMTGELDSFNQNSYTGAFGLYGSVSGAIGGQVKIADNLMLLGGFSGGSNDYDTFDYNGALGTLALRYDFDPLGNGLRPFAQTGGSYGVLNDLTFKRTYANGGGTATGEGTTSGRVGSVNIKAGVAADLGESDQVVLAVEAGQRWLTTDAYTESPAGNPFPAIVDGGTDRQTVVKGSASWTHAFTPQLDMTLRAAAAGIVEGSSGLRAASTGFGTMTTSVENQTWVEGGARLGWKATETVQINLYATGMSGEAVESSVHVGAGVQLSF